MIADAVARGCGGAVVISAGFGEIAERPRAGAGAPRGGAGRRAAAVRPERQRDLRGQLAGADVGGLGAAAGARRRGDDLPERQRRGQRARLAPRDPLPHGPLHRQPGGARRQRLARGDLRARGRALGGAVPGGGRRRRAPRRVARALRRAWRPGGRAEGGRLRGRRARGLRAYGRGRGRPEGVPRPGRGGGRRLGRATRTSCSSSPAFWPSGAPGRAATAGSRSSPARAATPASPPTRPLASAPSCPSWPPGPASDWRSSCPRRRRSATRSTTRR